MMYLAFEIIVWLIAAAFVGLIVGWLLRASVSSRVVALADDNMAALARMTSAEADFEAKTLAAEAAIARLKADLHVANNRATAMESTGGDRFAELERALKSQVLAAEAVAAERGHALEQTRNMFTTAQAEWSHRAGSADSRAADAEQRASEAEARVAAAEASLRSVQATIPPDRSDELEALRGEHSAVSAERDALRDRLSAAEAEAGAMLAAEAPDGSADLAALTAERDALKAQLAALESQPAAPARKARAKPTGDDFTAIEGLGPTMARALKAAGVETYAALAALSADDAKAMAATMPRGFADRFVSGGWAEKAQALAGKGDG